ncbi:GNAT family N-acetyltransferase, partial [Vibrio sp. V39_P1S14PM300]
MAVTIRQGSLQEVIQVVEQIAEFAQGESVATLKERIADKPHLTLVAEEAGELLGFKLGYQLDADTFYSWFGGVSPLARNKGVAQQLLDVQEQWACAQGYRRITVKSRNQFPAMLRLLLRN